MNTREISIDVTATQIREMTALGFWKEEDGVLVLTEAGNAWVRDWVAKRIKAATDAPRLSDPGDECDCGFCR